MNDAHSLAHLVLLLAFPAAQVLAIIEDARTMTISNWLSIALLAAFIPLIFLADWSFNEIGLRIAIGLVTFALLALAFYRGMVGGGDAKFLSASVPWVAPQDLMIYLFIIVILGGLLGIFAIGYRKYGPQRDKTVTWLKQSGEEIGIPYGIAIGLAGLWIVWSGATFTPLWNIGG